MTTLVTKRQETKILSPAECVNAMIRGEGVIKEVLGENESEDEIRQGPPQLSYH